jgi:type I restriction-modification system DNA methylase subunit
VAEDPAAAEDPDEYLADNIFWVPKEARWSHLQANAKQPTIGKLIDDAMAAIEAHNPGLKGVLPKDYNRPALDKVMVGELIDLISGIAMGESSEKAKDILGRGLRGFAQQHVNVLADAQPWHFLRVHGYDHWSQEEESNKDDQCIAK